MTATLKFTHLQNVLQHSLVDIHRYFGEICCLHLQGRESTGECSFEMLLNIYQTIQRHISERINTQEMTNAMRITR
jgi:hypothetical protein